MKSLLTLFLNKTHLKSAGMHFAVVLSFLFTLLLSSEASAAAVIIDPNNGTSAVTVAYSQTTSSIQFTFTEAGNGTFTLTMPAGVTYIPGSMTFTASAGAVVAQSNITNLGAPVFIITGATVGANVVVSYGIRAGCATQGSASIGVSITVGSSTDVGTISISILKAALTIDAHDAAVSYSRGGSGSSTTLLTNGGNGSLDSLIFYFKQNGPLVTDSVKANGHLATYIGAVGDTLFYQMRSVHFPGGTLDNGESITITRYFHVPVCGVTYTSFQSTYLANFGRNGARCQSPTPGDFGQYNYNSASGGNPTAAVAQVAVDRQASPCQTALVRYRYTSGSTGTVAYGTSYDVWMQLYGGTWPANGYKVKSITLVSNNMAIPYTFNTSNTAILIKDSPVVQGTDPDGAGVGLEDLDGDGYYDDMNPGQNFQILVEWEYQKSVPCSNDPAGHVVYLRGWTKNLCGEDISSGQLQVVGGNMHATGILLLNSSPTELGSGQTGTMQAQVSRTGPSLTYLSCPTNQWQVRFPLAPGMTVSAMRAGTTNLSFSVVADTVVAIIAGTVPNPFFCDVDFSVTPGVTPNGTSPTIILAYSCNSTCPNSREDVSCLAGPGLSIPAPGICEQGGGLTSNSLIQRITTGFTNYTGTAHVPLSSITPLSRKRGLPCDSVLVTSTGGMQAGTVITGGEPLYYEVSYNLHGTTNRLFQWVGGTYTYQSATAALPAPVYEANYNGKHYAIYSLGSYPIGAVVNISLYGIELDAATLTNTLEGVAGFGNLFFNLDDGYSNPSPNGGDTRYTCTGQALEFYVRNPRGAFQSGLIYGGGGTCTSWTEPTRYWYLRGTNGSGPEIDYFPGEVRPMDILDSIVVNLPSGYTYVPGNDNIVVGGNANDGGYPASPFITFSVTPSAVQGQRIVWRNPGTWYVPDDALTGGYKIYFNVSTDCTVPGYQCGFSVPGIGNGWPTYYGHRNVNSRNPGCPPTFVRSSSGHNTFGGRPVLSLVNQSGTQNADQQVECFNIKLNVSCATGYNSYIYFPGGGPSGSFKIVSVKNTTTNVTYPILQAAGGQWAQLGNLGGDNFYQLCSEYSNCANPDIPYIISWGCSGYPANPAVSGCSSISGTLDLAPAPSGLQAQFIAQPVNPVPLCEPLVYDFNMLSTLAADLVDPRLEVHIPSGMAINTVQIEYPYNSGNFETVTPAGTTGTVTIPYGLHSTVHDSLPGVNFQTMPNPRTARMRLSFLTDCSFTSGSRISILAKGEEPCGAPAQGNNTLVYSDPINIAGITQNYISLVNNLNIGPDTIITCENRTVSMDMVMINTAGIPVTLDPALDSMKIDFPSGIGYVAGSYNCTSGSDCFNTPVVHPVNGNLAFAVPSGITIPAAGSVTVSFSIQINALVNEGCGLPGGLTVSMVRSFSGVGCSTQSGGICPNPVRFITGSVTKQISPKKADISTITAQVCRSSSNNYSFNGTFAISQGAVPAMQSVVVEVFCLSGGNPVGAPVATQTVNGLLNTSSGNIPFSGTFSTTCAGEQFQVRLSPVTDAGSQQCVCSAVSTNVGLINPTFTVTTGSACAGSVTVKVPLTNITNGGNKYKIDFDDPAITDITTATNIPAGGILVLPIPSNLASGTYTGTVTVQNSTTGCEGNAPFSFEVHATPTVNSPIIFCVGTVANITGSGTPATTNPYVSSNVAIATVNSAGVITGVTPGTLNVTYTDNFGCTAVSAITVNPLPTITGTTTVCVGSSITLTGSGIPNMTTPWVSSNNGIATVSSSGVVTGVSAGTAVMTYTNDNGCIKTAAVTVLPLPSLTGGSVCIGEQIQLTSVGIPAAANPYVSSDPAVATVNNTGLVTGVSLGSSMITFTNSNGCQAVATVTVSQTSLTVSAVSFVNQSSCNDNGTPSLFSDDYFTADVAITFSNPPVTGDLVISGDIVTGGGPTSVPVATAGAGPVYTFTGVRFKADNTATIISVEFTDGVGCSFNVNNGPVVNSCVTPSVTVVDACECFDVFYGLPEFDPLEFIDSIKVTSNPGETWHFVSHTGLEVPNPTINVPLPQDTVLVESMPGMYGIRVSHTSGVGYSGVITNGTVILNVGATCTNPELTIPNLAGNAMCQASPVFSFSEIAATLAGMNAPGIFTFNIVRAPGDTLFNVTSLNPALMPNNTTIKVIGRYVPSTPGQCPHNFSYSVPINNAACPCELEINAVTAGPCDPATNTYDLTVNIAYQYLPVGDNIVITTSTGETQSFIPAAASGAQEFVISGVPNTSTPNVSVTAAMQFFGVCNATLANAYDEPVNCAEPPCTGNPGAINGHVFNDTNNDGSSANEPGQSGVEVLVYDCNGNLVGTTTSGVNGAWSLSGLTNGQQYTVVFNIPTSMNGWTPGLQGANNAGDVQFAIPQDCDLDFGVINQENYCQDNPLLAVSRQYEGPQSYNGAGILGIYQAQPESFSPTSAALTGNANIGTTYGVAYHRVKQILFTSAMVRHYFGYGPGGFDAIYPLDFSDLNGSLPPTATATAGTTINLAALGVNMGTDPRTTPLTGTAPFDDGTVYQQVGKVGIGDIEMSTTGDTLFVVNLNAAAPSLVLLNVANPSAVSLIAEIPLPSASCSGGSFAPWGLKTNGGRVYVGGVCTAETSQNAADLDAKVYRWDGGTTFTQVVSMNLDYLRGPAAFRSDDTYTSGDWRPWTNVWNPDELPLASGNLVSQPQPILQDMEFMEDGSLVLGFGDRFSYQAANGNRRYDQTTGSTVYTPVPAGDIIRFCNTAGGYVLEGSSAACPQPREDLGSVNLPSPFPVVHEYFSDSYSNEFNNQAGFSETALGALARIPGSPYLLSVNHDPMRNQGPLFSSGVRTLNAVGSYNKGWLLVDEGDPGSNRSGGNLGDIEALCNTVPVEIGDFVWIDTNNDGKQSACESALAGVTVELYKKDGTLIGQTTTGATGKYYFNTSNVDTIAPYGSGGFTGLSPNTNYYVVVGKNMGQFNTGTNKLSIGAVAYDLTVPNTGTGSFPDHTDSDGSLLSGLTGGAAALNGFPGYCVTTPYAGSDYTFDFGFVPPCIITGITFSATTSCNDNGTISVATDDYFTADITVTFATPPATGTLNLTGDVVSGGGALSVPVATAGAGPTYTFAGVRLKADGTASAVTATFSATPLCTFSITNGPSVNSCVTPMVSLVESCGCFDVFYGLPEFDPLEFTDSIKVTSNPGETWHFVSHTGLEVPHPTINIPLPQDTMLVESMPGMYGIKVSTTSGVGYSGVITNGTVTLNVGNLCTNPSLTIPNLAGSVMCPTSPPFQFSEITARLNGVNAPGTFTFNIVRAPGDTLFNVTSLDPALMINGSTVKVLGRYVPSTPGQCPHNFSYSVQVNSAACPCDLDVNSASASACDPATSTYSLTVNVAYEHAPTGEGIVITTGSGATATFMPAFTSGSESFVLTGLTANGVQDISVSAHFATTTTCTGTLTNAYDAPTSCTAGPCMVGPGTIGGTSFNDANNNGASAGETGVQGIIARVYDCNGNLVGTTTTDASGNWSIPGLTTGQTYRVEFNIPASLSYLQPSQQGVGNGTDVQFVMPGTCDVNFGVIDQDDYCQNNPLLAVPRLFTGPQNNNDNALLGIYNNSPQSTSPTTYGLAKDINIGSTYGVAYQRSKKTLYTSALVRHYFGYGPGGFDAIYGINFNDPNNDVAPNPTTTLGTTIDLSALGVNMGTDPRTAPITGNAPYNDGTVYQKVGKAGIGDIDISTIGDTLFAVNLNSAAPSLVLLNVANPAAATLISEIPIPSTACTGGGFAPFALKYHKGKVYIGGVCTAETSQNVANLDAYVYRWDGGTTFTQIATMDLNYPRGAATYRSDDTYSSAAWRAWTNTWNPITLPLSGGDLATQPQPILQDIEFESDGSLILGFGDRFSYQAAYGNRRYDVTTGSTFFSPVAAGDVVKMCKTSGGYVLESNALACEQTIFDLGSTNIPAIPDFKEFYDDNFVNPANAQAGHSEVALGGLAKVPGSSSILAVTYDPIKTMGLVNSSGIRTINSNGSYNKGWTLVKEADPDCNRKGGNMGDVEALCNAVPVEIGNYVWVDTDKDGIQDPCETPLAGVKVELYKKDGTLIGQTTTNASGAYYFNQTNVDTIAPFSIAGPFTGLSPSTAYFIVVGKNMTQFNTTTNELTIGATNYQVTAANTGAGALPDQNDSDGSLLSGVTGGGSVLNGYPGYLATTPGQGSNHTFDFGFIPVCRMTNITLAGASACNDNGTPSLTDDYYTVNITITYANAPVTGTLTLTGDVIGTYSVAVGSLGSATSHTFTNVQLKADGTTTDLTATFSADLPCTFSITGPTVAPCSACATPPSVVITEANVNTCGTNAATFNYTVANGPATITTSNGTLGNFSLTTLANGSGTFTYTPAGSEIGQVINLTATIGDPDGVGPCVASTDVATVTVNALPTLSGGSVCVGNTITLTGSGTAAAVNPYVSSNTAVATITSGGVVTGVSAGMSTITFTDNNGCQGIATVTVNALPTMAGGMVCIGSTITVAGSGSPAAINPYVSSNTAVATVTSGGVVTGVSAGTSMITYTDNSGCQVTATLTVQNCCVPPIADFIAVPAECDNGVMENNGRIVLMSHSGVDRVGYSTGATYTGPVYAMATALPGTLPADVVVSIPNGTSAIYTIRVFNGANNCYRDYTVNVASSSACVIDPMGFIYCEETGEIIAGGTISVSGPGAVLITKDGTTGEYQFFTDGTPGTYTMTYTPPTGYALSSTRTPLVSIDPTGQPNPYYVGSGSTNGVTLDDFSAGANPYTFNFVLAPGDPEVQRSNIPLSGCCIPPVLTVNNTTVCRGSSVNLATLVSNAGGGSLSYYTTQLDAQLGVNALASPTVTVTTATNYYVRSQTRSDCYTVKEVTVNIRASNCSTITISGPH